MFVTLLLFGASSGDADVTPTKQAEAARANNLGTALMNQQLLEKAAGKFGDAFQLDPSLVRAEVNRGIALVYLQKMPEAKQALEHAATLDPKDPHIWYALGILHRIEAEYPQALESFQKVAALDPDDADTHYFLGSVLLELHQPDQALTEFQTALRLNPIHASAQFGLAKVLQRLGKREEAATAFHRFEHLNQEKIGVPLAHTYGDEGHYSLAQDARTLNPQVRPMIPVTFTSQTLDHLAASPAKPSDQPRGGACLVTPAGEHAYLLVMASGEEAIRTYAQSDSGSFALVPSAQTGLVASGTGVACTVGDFDNDGLPDVAVAMSDRVLLFKNRGGGKFTDVTAATGVQPANRPAGITFVDYDHDGDLDLFVTGQGSAAGSKPNVLWRNNGNGTFTNWTEQAGLGGEGTTVAATLSDLNNDRAVDLLVTGSGQAPTFFANPREGLFKSSPLFDTAGLPPTVGAVVLDFNKDGWMDVALTHAGSPGITLWRNVQGKRFERVPLPIENAIAGWGLTAIDLDNDGWLDLVAAVQTKQGPELRALRNLGPAGFEDVTARVKLDQVKLAEPRALIAADVDGDGAADLIVTQPDGNPLLLHNEGGNRNHSLLIALKGVADNKSAIGTKVEVFADGVWQKFEIAGASGYLSQGAQQLLAGLGTAEHADLVRILWPTGVPQDETELGTKSSLNITELDRRGSSCPTLFAWNGKRYEFISDVIGAAVIGHWVSPTAKNHADPDEWIKVEGSQLSPRGGYLSLRFGEPMEEVNFIDQVRLVAIDHPAATEVYPDERFLNEPPFASGRAILSTDAHPVAGAWDDKGRDVRELLRTRDHNYVRDFTNLSFAGFANQHALTLDLGQWTAANPLRLLLHGFIEYFSASSMYAAWQSGLTPMPPYVEAQLPDGSWKRVMDDMGFPAGLPRTIVVDLTGKLPPGTRRIRLVTNLQIYWDQALIDNGPPAPQLMHQTELPLASAHLAFRGYPEQIDGKTPGDLTYNYEHISQTGPFIRSRGSYTRYGEVTPLLKSIDESFVIFGSGEDIDVEFGTASLPPLKPGWKRDYFFYANGFVKDMDFYEASPFTVAEMPFHRMSTYPYPASEHYPQDDQRMQYELEWNDRFDSGRGAQYFGFRYLPKSAQ
ncbi:MAG TPA: FG-GAP-like repeat-containing protein [Acidobacteriaceae bacterium]|nr:FG-GAP-like repeat-containing protein [Acidobacteriaceae bacterium]